MDSLDLILTALRYTPVALMIVALAGLLYLQIKEAYMQKNTRYQRRY